MPVTLHTGLSGVVVCASQRNASPISDDVIEKEEQAIIVYFLPTQKYELEKSILSG